MRKTRLTVHQIVGTLKRAEQGMPIKEIRGSVSIYGSGFRQALTRHLLKDQ